MRLKISTPERVVFQGEIKGIVLPTESGTMDISIHHKPMVAAIKPGIIKISAFDIVNKNEFITSKNDILISVEKGTVFVDGKIIRVVTSSATTIPVESTAILEKNKLQLEEHIRALKSKGSIEEIETYLNKLEKINADLMLKKLQVA